MSMLEHVPCLDLESAAALAEDHYGLPATATPLPSERDQNFLLQTVAGERFILKVANAREDRALLETQHAALEHLAARTALTPRVVLTTKGAPLAEVVGPTGASHLARLVTYLPGRPLGRLRRHAPALLRDLGRAVAEVDRALLDFDHPALHRDFHWDLAQGPRVVRDHAPLISDIALRALVERFAVEFGEVEALLPGLRRSAIHNDANDYNVLVNEGADLFTRHRRVAGLIDFGDMVHSYTVGGLAVAAAYALLEKPDPLAAAAEVVTGYQAVLPLRDDELAALWGLITMRLCMSACLAAHQQRRQPDNAYLSISQAAVRRALPRLAQVHPRLATAVLRAAAGLAPLPVSTAVQSWLRDRVSSFAPVLGMDLRSTPLAVLDLGVGSPLLRGEARENAAPHLAPQIAPRLAQALRVAGSQVGVGRYDEARLAKGPATIHLGLDLLVEPGTPVYAPLAGMVVAAGRGPGPTLVLEHHTDAGQPFYTLYSRLDAAAPAGRRIGQAVARGERLGMVGTMAENGGQPPHLHLQLIVDLLDMGGDFPGLAPAGQRGAWRALSPDPNLLLGIPAERFPAPPPDTGAVLAARRRLIGPSVRLSYREPFQVVRGWMQYLYDEAGRRYLDAYNNVPHVGHCHPRVVGAGQAQMAVLNTNTRYLHDTIARYAERLCATLPVPLRVCFLVNSGSEANELALRLARAHTGQRDTVVLEAAYHGHTTTMIDISPYKHAGPGGGGAPPWVHTVPIPDDYRGPYRRGDPQAGARYAQHVREVVERLRTAGRGLAAYIAETCPSVGGQIFLPPGYLAEAYAHVRAAGGLCIADEVQTGYGRLGTHFYAFEGHGVVPDIVVLGKPIGNGHPLGAVITSPEIAASFDNGLEFFSTFGGNTVSCAIGLAVLEVVQEEGLPAHALAVGERLLAGLRPLAGRFPLVGDVRGSGLFIGVELVRDRETLEPAGEEAAWVVNRLREEGILLGTDGPYHNVLKIRPPMPFTAGDGDLLVAVLERVLEEF